MDPFFRSYDPAVEEKEVTERFGDQSEITCGCCGSKFSETKPRVWDANCTKHNSSVCRPCYQRWLASNIKSPKTPCIYRHSCEHELRPSLIGYLCKTAPGDSPLKAFDRISWLEQRTAQLLSTLISCPNCHRQSFGDSYCELAECPHCDARFCSFCHELTDSDREHHCTLLEWMVEMGQMKTYRAPEHADKKNTLQKYIDAGNVGEAYEQSFKVGLCPNCHAICQKVDGCGSVRCLTCRHSFGWSRAIDPMTEVDDETKKKVVDRRAAEKAIERRRARAAEKKAARDRLIERRAAGDRMTRAERWAAIIAEGARDRRNRTDEEVEALMAELLEDES